MNKQELIEKLKSDLTAMSEFEGSKYEYGKGYRCATKQHLEMLSDLDEPEKPVVPQFVADMIAEKKNQKYGIVETIQNLNVFNNPFDYIIENQFKWVIENQEDFIKAWLYGYEVEKEKLYTVEIPNPNGDGYGVVYLGRNEYNKIELRIWDCYSSIEFSDNWKQFDNAQLTESEIKEDFSWAWPFAEGVEE